MRYLFALFALLTVANAQFGNLFDQMFGQGEESGQQQGRRAANNPSDAAQYRQRYEQSSCDKYLCPDTLACVHFPHHCPCAWDSHEDKYELSEGRKLCVSKGGFKPDEAARKIELARKGLL
ncbi:component of the endoplasmic reticulum- associated degradation (ERAD) pathway [Geosmithia morbida]|uniref:Long chronological lifespan protein 2 n=1 Tax=Geosmithia morbida TaxID=1094350 RepID=A0A9P4YS61_9HYPO|nr:component of the endoplasmic reticulum- associated degradation (ERAD) pathway [Geosmithia morbida]KAF4120656.1 component of the endoplasmic reticulum- associated degradation (ERAD) pathway [Geosmithia morbida]